MKTSTLINKLIAALDTYGDLDVTVSETLWMYNSIKQVLHIKHPYQDPNETVIELIDSEYEEDKENWEIL